MIAAWCPGCGGFIEARAVDLAGSLPVFALNDHLDKTAAREPCTGSGERVERYWRVCAEVVSYRGASGRLVSFVCKHILAPGETACICCTDGSYDHAKLGVCSSRDDLPMHRATRWRNP